MAKVGWRGKSLQKYINQIDLKINVMLSKNEMPLILWQPDHISWIPVCDSRSQGVSRRLHSSWNFHKIVPELKENGIVPTVTPQQEERRGHTGPRNTCRSTFESCPPPRAQAEPTPQAVPSALPNS